MLQFLMWINVKVFQINNKNKDVNSLMLIKGMGHIGRLVLAQTGDWDHGV